MILRVDKIEIQQQPERKRFWAEVEVMAPNGFRRKVIMTPNDQGHWGMLRAIGEYLDEFLPKPATSPLGIAANPAYWEATGDPAAWPAPAGSLEAARHAEEHTLSPAAVRYTPSPAYLDALRAEAPENPEYWNAATLNTLNLLRAEAEAAGVRVDRRWGEARLREEIAAVARGGAPQDA